MRKCRMLPAALTAAALVTSLGIGATAWASDKDPFEDRNREAKKATLTFDHDPFRAVRRRFARLLNFRLSGSAVFAADLAGYEAGANPDGGLFDTNPRQRHGPVDTAP